MSNKTILVVEDDAILAMALKGRISRLGYDVAGPFASGEKAIAFLPGKQVDLVLMDIELTGHMNGITTAEILLGMSDIPVVFLTAYSQNSLLAKAKTVSPYGYLVKPVSDQALAATLEMSLHRHKVDLELKESRCVLAKSKEKFRTVADYIYDWEYWRAIDGSFVYISPSCERITGYKPEEFCQDPGLLATIIHPDDRENFAQHIDDIAKGVANKDFQTLNFRITTRSGKECYIEHICREVFNQAGNSLGRRVTNRDITEGKRAEVEKAKMQAQLQQAQKMEAIGTLAGGIAHDFNNILGAILGYAEMAQEDSPAGSMLRNDIDQVVKASHRAKDLVKQILAFSRLTETELIPMQPAIIVREAAKMLRSSLPSTIDIQQDIDVNSGPILADPTQIHQIVMNLGTNALHAMEETGGTLSISLERKTLAEKDIVSEPGLQPGDYVQLSIGDTGPGIAPELWDKIFDPYFTTKEIGKGTGMGLAIIHGIVKSYGGCVFFHSRPEEGTIFQVLLPVVAEDAVVEDKPEEIVELANERILFIDDEEILAEMGKSMLERLGYQVTVRSSSLEALTTFQNQPDMFDLVITDQTMPGMTGSDLARRILQIRPFMPIILCTGYSSLISEEKARSLGIKGFATKPLTRKDIAVLIRKALEKRVGGQGE
jgi:PAS domain S-box-containing protein